MSTLDDKQRRTEDSLQSAFMYRVFALCLRLCLCLARALDAGHHCCQASPDSIDLQVDEVGSLALLLLLLLLDFPPYF